MSENTKIEWCDHTFNPWEGCTKVSPGCANCYAETRNARWNGGTAPNWGPGAPRRRTSMANWRQPLRWNDTAICRGCGETSSICAVGGNLGKCPKCHRDAMRQPRVFCASLADWLDDEVPLRWLIDLLEVIRDTPWLDWLLLTKRPENFHRRMQAVFEATNEAIDLFVWDWFYHGRAPRNVWIGTTVEDQARANDRIPKLLEIPARVRFLSCEPLLGPVEFSNVTKRSDAVSQLGKKALSGIDWVICGGESGPKARPMHPHWARSMRDQCAAAGVPFFFKQWGEWAPEVSFYGEDEEDDHDSDVEGASVLEPTGYIVPDRGDRFEYQPMPGSWILRRTGKKAAGRLVDGVEHSAFPEPL